MPAFMIVSRYNYLRRWIFAAEEADKLSNGLVMLWAPATFGFVDEIEYFCTNSHIGIGADRQYPGNAV